MCDVNCYPESLLDSYKLSLIKEEKSELTVSKYMRDLHAFLQFIDKNGRKKIDKEAVICYKEEIQRTYRPSSVNSMLAAVNSFLSFAGLNESKVRLIKIQRRSFRRKEDELTIEEYFRLLHEAQNRGNERLYMIMQTLCSTGIRISELPFITVQAARSGSALVSLKGKVRYVIIPDKMGKKLLEYAHLRGIQSGSIFLTRGHQCVDRSNILHEMKDLAAKSHVDRGKIYPHNLRHLFATTYYRAEKNPMHLADILGHSSINTTRIYTSVNKDDQREQIDHLGLVI